MNQLSAAALLSWPIICLVFFAFLQPRYAVAIAFLGAWVFLPPKVGYSIAGLPDYTKYMAGDVAAIAGTLLFAPSRLSGFRLRWFDLPMIAWLLIPVASVASNGQAVWDAVSGISDQVITWGVPYFMGRLHFTNPTGTSDLALCLVGAGLVTFPMVAYELFTEQSLSGIFYNLPSYNRKYGFYSPSVFSMHQLEMGIWMTLTAAAAFWLWCANLKRRLLGLRLGICSAILIIGAFFCHQTAAMALLAGSIFLAASTAGRPRFGRLIDTSSYAVPVLLVTKMGLRMSGLAMMGLAGFQFLRNRRPQVIAWAMVLVAPTYIVARSSGIWSGESASHIAYMLLGPARAESLDYRFTQEERMINHAMRRPLFGWGLWGKNRGEGAVQITDGLWMIMLGQYGLLGLAALYGNIALSQAFTIRRYHASSWSDPASAAPVAMVLVLTLYAVDSLLNASPANPIVPMITGTLLAQAARRPEEVLSAGDPTEAEAWDHLAIQEAEAGRWGRALEAAGHATDAWDMIARSQPDAVEPRQALAFAWESRARCASRLNRPTEAVAYWEQVVAVLGDLARGEPANSEPARAWARALNDLAWLLVKTPASSSSASRAEALAERAVMVDPEVASYWNTLGLAYYRVGNWDDALAALEHSATLGGEAYMGANDLLASLVRHGQGEPGAAAEALSRAEARLANNPSLAEALRDLRLEAASRIGPATATR
jgi:tetratricopeptide (TPR) repeat protein